MATITPKQKKVLDFVKQYSAKKGFAPSQEEIKRHLRLRSVATVHQHLNTLERKGYLHRQKSQPRGVEISNAERMIQIQLLGRIAAGVPIEAITNKETIAVPQSRLPFPSGNYYALRVQGDSMIDENINNGDIVLVRKQNTAQNGEKVVALLDNSDATLKTFYKERGQIRLQPANKKYQPIIVESNREIAIQGVVIDVIRTTEKDRLDVSFAAPPARATTKKLPLNKIICGDTTKELQKLPDESVDVIIADPPYNIGKDFGNNIDKRELTEYVRWSNIWMRECIRIMKPTATLFIYGFSEILAHLSIEIPISKRWLIWHYTNKNVASINFWQRSHEAIICAWKGKPIFNRDKVREPYTEGFLNGAAGKVRRGTIGRYGKDGLETIYRAHEGGALPRDVLKIPALAGGAGMIERWFLCKTCNDVYEPRQLQKHTEHEIMKHPTQKPLELTRKLIKSAMPENRGVVLIPFVGTGSECVVAKQLDQSYIGFEINPEYIRIANKMLTN